MRSVDPRVAASIENAGTDASFDEVEQRARLLLLDTIACAVAGLRHAPVQALASVAEPGSVTFPGLGRSVTVGDAARIFTAAACWDEYCEGHAGARGRPGLHSVAPALVLSGRSTLREVLAAMVAGYNTGALYGMNWLTAEGLHVDGSWGGAAAAAAAARAMGLGRSQAVSAVRIAASMPGANLYAAVPAGATSRNLYAAEAVVRGISAARAAAAGVTGPADAIAQTVTLLGRPTEAELPQTPPLLGGYLKPWPGVRHAHYAIAAALRWRERFGWTSGPLVLDMHPQALEYTGVRAPETVLQAQFSSTWCAAHALVTGTFDLHAYEDIGDPRVRAVERQIELVSGAGVGRWAVLSGEPGRVRIDEVPGDPAEPLRPDQVRAKAMSLMSPRLGSGAEGVARFVLEAPLAAGWWECPV